MRMVATLSPLLPPTSWVPGDADDKVTAMKPRVAASTVAPGITAPDVSFTTPAMAPVVADWAHARFDTETMTYNATTQRTILGRAKAFLQPLLDGRHLVLHQQGVDVAAR